MKRISLQSSRILILSVLVLNIGIINTHLYAGTSGKISGRIIDGEAGVPLPGVNVILEGERLGASTDANGQYYIINVPVGVYSVRASMMGYAETRVSEVKVLGDLTTEVNFSLTT